MTAGALPAWVSAGSTFSATATGTHLVNVPAHDPGDLLLLTAHARASNNDGAIGGFTPGWIQIGGGGATYGGAQASRVAIGWIAGDGAMTGVAVAFGGTGTTVRFQARVHRFSGADGFGPNPIQSPAAVSGTSATVTMPTVSPAGLNRLAGALIGVSASTAMTAATGEVGGDWTEPIGEHASTNGTLALQLSNQPGGGAISGGTISITSANWVALGFAIRPAEIYEVTADDLMLTPPALGSPDTFQVLDLADVSVVITDQDVVAHAIADT